VGAKVSHEQVQGLRVGCRWGGGDRSGLNLVGDGWVGESAAWKVILCIADVGSTIV